MSAEVYEIALADWRCAECGVGGREPVIRQLAENQAAVHDELNHEHINPEGEDA